MLAKSDPLETYSVTTEEQKALLFPVSKTFAVSSEDMSAFDLSGIDEPANAGTLFTVGDAQYSLDDFAAQVANLHAVNFAQRRDVVINRRSWGSGTLPTGLGSVTPEPAQRFSTSPAYMGWLRWAGAHFADATRSVIGRVAPGQMSLQESGHMNTPSSAVPSGSLEALDLDNFDVVVSRILDLLMDEDEDDFVAKPTASALERALTQVRHARDEIGSSFPRAAAAPDGEGGVGLFWTSPERSVRLIVPPQAEQPIGLYRWNMGESQYQTDTTPTELAHQLDWFASA